MVTGKRKMDLTPDDVHQPGPVKAKRRKPRLKMKFGPGGALAEVHHMSDGDEIRHLTGVELESSVVCRDDAAPVWIQLAKTGTFRGHPAGPFELNSQVFSDIVRNFEATQNRAIPIDFEHASESDPTQGSIPVEGAPAQGWIRDLRVQGGNLWGLVEWGDLARDYIRSGKYRYFSPAIRFGAKDRVTGERIGARMTSGGLTNNPFLDGMAPLTARDELGQAKHVAVTAPGVFACDSNEYMPALRQALKLPTLATAREVDSAVASIQVHYEASGRDPSATVQGIRLSDYVVPLRDAVRMPMTSTVESILSAVCELVQAARRELGDYDDGADSSSGSLSDVGMSDDDDDLGTAVAAADSKETATMADNVLLSEAQAKNAELTLTLKDRDARISALEAELVSLRDWKATEEASKIQAEVDEAYETYRDSKNLTDADRETLLVVCKAAPDAFRRLYPRVPVTQRHLLRSIVPARPAVSGNEVKTGAPSVDVDARAKQLMAEKGIDYENAWVMADKELRTRR
jgi:hypothetical protein